MTTTDQKTPALNIQNAKKSFGKLNALNGVNLQVKQGEFFGLLGPNGAGKSTLIKSIMGLNRLSEGDIYIFGHHSLKDHQKSKGLLGYSPQEPNVERYFTLKQNLEFQAGYFGVSRKEQKQRAQELLQQFSLSDKTDVKFFKLSGGMQKRASIAKALVNKPKLLILDEPTAGVDVEQRHELWKYLRKLNQDGTTIILTTHYIDEAQALCDRIGIINHGEVKELGTPQDLIQKYCQPKLKITTNKQINSSILSQIKNVSIKQTGNTLFATGDKAGVMTQNILKTILDQPDITVEDILVEAGNLEGVFLKVTGQTLTEARQ